MPATLRRLLLFTRAYLRLLRIQQVLLRRGFSGIQSEYLLPWKTESRVLRRDDALVRDVEWAVYQACAWQFRRTVCLHRATLAYSLLRACGTRPHFIMAVASRPFGSHAWVELDGEPIADREMDDSRYYYRPILSLPGDTPPPAPPPIAPRAPAEAAVR